MTFNQHNWSTGDTITADLLNRLEQALSGHDSNITNMLNNLGDLTQLSTSSKTNLVAALNELKGNIPSGGGTSVLVYNTLADLQTAYPNGANQPVWVIADNAWYYWSSTIPVTAPVDITGLTSSNISSSSLTLSWTSSTGATSYDVYQGSTLLGNTVSNSYNVTGLTASTSYTFKVVAKNTGGSAPGTGSGASVSATTLVSAPANVTGLATSSVTQTTLTLSWTGSTGATSYDVYNGSTLLGNTTSATYNVSGLTAGTSYTFKVIAKNAGGSSSGTTVSATTTVTAPNDVTNLTTNNISATSLTLAWTASSGATSYDVYIGATLLGNTANSSYQVTGLTASTAYTFKVVAKNAGGSSAGVTLNVTTLASAPNPVTNLTAGTVTSSSIPVTWSYTNGSDAVANFEVAYSSNSGNSYTVASNVVNASSTSYTVSGLSASTAYVIRVVAIDSSGNRSTAVTINATTSAPADTTPPVVTASPAAGTYTSAQTVTLSATDNSGGAVTIYYTTDGTTPTIASNVYTAPISISATTTLQFIGKDAAGNISTPVAATYTINAVAQAKYLQMNGTTDWLRLPSMTFDQVVMDVQLGTSTNAYILDARTGIANGQVMNGNNGYSNWGAGISSALKDGVAMNNVTNGTFVANERHTYTFNYTSAGTDNVNIFSANNVDQASNSAAVNNSFQGNIYDVKLYNAGTLVAHYDFTTGSLTDQTGQQGKALLTGGTWVGVTAPTTTQYLQLNGTTDYVRVPNNAQLQLTNNFKIQIKASLNDLTQTDAYLLGKYRYGVHKYYSNPNAKIEMLSNGATGTVPAGTMTVSDNNAHTFVLNYDGTTFTTSLDGTNIYSGAASFTFATSTDSLYIGANSYNSGFLKMNVYDVQITNGGTLVAHYDFTKGTAQDQSGNNNNGILTGGTWF